MGVNWKGESPFVWEHRCPAVLHGQQDDANTRARQLRDREISWEGSPIFNPRCITDDIIIARPWAFDVSMKVQISCRQVCIPAVPK